MIDLATPIDSLPLFDFNKNFKLPSKESFQFIFFDNINYFRHLYNIKKLRPVSYDHIQKTILCGSFYLGWDFYECPTCGKETIIPHSCHSRFCTKCGAKETKQRADYVSSMAIEAPHRHIVFTIPWELRPFFMRHRILLNDLFLAASNTLSCVFNHRKFRKLKNKHKSDLFPMKKSKTKYAYKDHKDKVISGSVMTLHTFGRNLQWNPHIHCLVCEEAFDSVKNKMINFSFISYEKLRKTWMYQVLNILSPKLGEDFHKIKKELYRICEDGFYVHAPKKENQSDDDIQDCVQYITRYTSRPPMAESRIINYNEKTKQIHWFYNKHEDGERVDVHQHVYYFLNDLVLHCPEENFKMTRYYGFYSNRYKPTLDKIYDLYGIKKKRKLKTWKQRKTIYKKKIEEFKYRCHMIQSYQRDPIRCSCGDIIKYSHTYNPFEGGKPNDRRYREDSIKRSWRLDRRRNDQNTRTT